MLRVFGNMQLVQLAGTPDQVLTLKAEAQTRGKDFLIEQGNYLYARAIFMGYDLPNGNGDAIPSLYAGTFGPSFIGKHLDLNHQLDPASMIGTIMATWHVEKPLVAGDGPRIIGRNMFGRDIEGRPRVFAFAPPVDVEPKELQLEGIFRIDLNTHAGKIVADKLWAKEMDSVSQEASTEYCLCSVCANKIAMPFDRACDHLVHGSLMLRSHKVAGYDQEILAYKVHHNPVGTGLGVVSVPAYDKAKLNELTAAIKAGHLTVEAFRKLVAEQELVWGHTSFVAQASRDLPLLAADEAKPAGSRKWSDAPPALAPGTEGTPGTPGTNGTPGTQLAPGTPLASDLRSQLNALVPMEGDDKVEVFRKFVAVAAAQARVNREALSLTRHVAMASVSNEMGVDGALDGLAQRVCRVAEVQATLDLTRRALLAGLDYKQKPGAPEGMLLASSATSAIGAMAMGLRVGGLTRTQVTAAKNRIDGFMPLVAEFQEAMRHILNSSEEAGASTKFGSVITAHASFTEHFDRWRDAKFPSDTDRENGALAKNVWAAFATFKAAYGQFEAAQMKIMPVDYQQVAAAIDAEFGVTGLSAAPRRLRMRAGTMDLVAAYQSAATEERVRAVVGAFSASTAEWLPTVEAAAIASDLKFTTSMQASDVVNGMGLIVAAMGRRTFIGGLKSKALAKMEAARRAMTTLVAAERQAAATRVLAKLWLKAFAVNPSFNVPGSAPAILSESGIKGAIGDKFAETIGYDVQKAGGPWPWTASKPQSWTEFVASQSDDELKAFVDALTGRHERTTDVLGKQVVAQNKMKLEAVLKDRQAAKGVVAKFFRQPVLADSHWTLFDADGQSVGRFTLAAAARGTLDRHVEMAGKKVYLGSWLQSEQYGRDIMTHAKLHGLTATLKQFEVKAGGGAGIVFENIEIADGGSGTIQEDGSVKWDQMPTLAKFDAMGYQDGMQNVRGNLLEVVGVEANLKGDCKPGDKVTLTKIDAKPVWQGGWTRSAPTVGQVITLDCSKGDFVFMVNDSFDAYAASGNLELQTTEDFVSFYQDVFDASYPEDNDVKDFCTANDIPFPENESELANLRNQMMEMDQDDASGNWSASKRVRANGAPRLRQLTLKEPLAKDEHNHGLGSDSIRHSHGGYERNHKHAADPKQRHMDSPGWREDDEQLVKMRDRMRLDSAKVKADRVTRVSNLDRKGVNQLGERLTHQRDRGPRNPELESLEDKTLKRESELKAGQVYRPMTGAEHGAFVAFCAALADALESEEFADIANNFPMSGSELTETLPAEMAAANVDIKPFVDAMVPKAQEAIDSVDKQLAGKTTVQELADEFGDKVWSDIVLQAMGHGVALNDDPGVSAKLTELGLGKIRPTIHLDDLGFDEAWQACNAYIQATTGEGA